MHAHQKTCQQANKPWQGRSSSPEQARLTAGAAAMPAHQAYVAEPVAAVAPRQQQALSTPYAKVASWLNSTYNSNGASTQSIKPRSGSGAPLLSRFSSSILWYVGLGGALHHKHRVGLPQPQQQAQQAQRAAGTANGSASPAVAAGAHASTAAGQPAQPLPMRAQGVLQAGTKGPASHPLTVQQIEQSMDFSTSSSAAQAAAPVQAVSKGGLRQGHYTVHSRLMVFWWCACWLGAQRSVQGTGVVGAAAQRRALYTACGWLLQKT